MKSQTNFGSILQNVQTSLWCIMSATLIGYLVLLQITQMLKEQKNNVSYKKKFWISFFIIISSNIVLILLIYFGLKDLQQEYAKDSGMDPFNLEYEIIFLCCSYAIIPLAELIIFQDRSIKAKTLLIPILFLVLISLVSTIFNLLIYGFDLSFFVFFRHLAYFALPAIFSQMNLNLLSISIE